ncbi:MAG: dihydroorotase [Bacteroidetes bacterium]|nr:dihydroorotase [Bacteroidota bacterium]
MTQQNQNSASYLIKGGQLINEGQIVAADILVRNGRIERIGPGLEDAAAIEINADGKYVIPGIIDDQVHFREPGLTHKASIGTESIAAVAGGVTSFMEMPNTKPAALTQELLQDKYDIAAATSPANYSFFMGASNENVEEVLKTDASTVCGVKVFMGSSTGNMLVDSETTLRALFSRVPMLMAAHCEDEATVRANTAAYIEKYGDNIPMSCHPEIRNEAACYISSALGVKLAKEYNTRFHILHISTAEELELFDNTIPLKEKRITSEVCVHHLFYSKDDYAQLGSQIKCNPAVKASHHKEALLQGLLNDKLDIIATDHAPHTSKEKANSYLKAPSGVPLVQHSLNLMLDFHKKELISLEKIVEKMCHAPADCFRVKERGYLREGYWADIAILDAAAEWTVNKQNILYKCGWSPLEGKQVSGKVTHTFVSGHLAWNNGKLDDSQKGIRLMFEHD